MTFDLLIMLGLKSTAIAIVALAACWLLRRRPARDQVAALCAGMLALFVLPWAALLLPSLDVTYVAEAAPPVPLGDVDWAVELPPEPAVQSSSLPSLIDLLLLVYLGGALLLVTRLAAGLTLLAGWTRRSAPVTDPYWLIALESGCAQARRRARLLVSSEIPSPFSWGVSSGVILIDRKTLQSPERAEAVIAHEMAHIRALDWPSLLIARVTTMIFWFNPLVWLLERTLSRRVEIAADESASLRVERFTYAQMLLDVANETQIAAPACGMASAPSLLSERLRHILSAKRPRATGRAVPLAILSGAALLAMPLAAARIVTITPPAPPEPAMLAAPAEQSATPLPDSEAEPSPAPARTAAPTPRQARPPRPDRPGLRSVSPPAPPAPPRPVLPVDQRQAAWEMTERAREMRRAGQQMMEQSSQFREQAQLAAAQERASQRAGSARPVHPRDRSDRSNAMLVEADRLDMAARRLLFGP